MKKLGIFIVLTLLASCKPLPPFHQDTIPNKPNSLAKVYSSLVFPSPTKTFNSIGTPIIIVREKTTNKTSAYNLKSSKTMWETATPNIKSKYVIASNKVVFFDAKKGIVALDLMSGRQVWSYRILPNHHFLGLTSSYSGKIAFVETYNPTGNIINQVSTVHLLSNTGKSLLKLSAKGRMGWPLLNKKILIVPYRSHFLVFIDTVTKKEIARLHINKGEIRFLKLNSKGLFFGDKKGLYKFTKNIIQDLNKPPYTFKSNLKNLEYRYGEDHYNSIMSDFSAYDSRMILCSLNGTKADFFQNNNFVFHIFKYFFGFTVDAKGDALLKWASFNDFNALNSYVTNDNFIYVTTDGKLKVQQLSTGKTTVEYNLPYKQIKGVTWDIANYIPESNVNIVVQPLFDSLTTIANDSDTRYPMAKHFSIDALAVVGGAGVAKLIKMIVNPKSSPMLKQKAIHDLIANPDPKGVPLYIDLINKPYDYITNSKPLAIGVMADVLGKLKSKKAVPILIKLLMHRETPKDKLFKIASSLLAIGDKRTIRPFREFLLTYRADPEFEKDIHPLQKMAEGLFKLGGPKERQVLIFISEDDKTLPRLKEYVLGMLKKTR